MRTISVKEASAALGITPRAVTYRLEKGQLKGTLSKNEFGVPEWRIYPNKEILTGLNQLNSGTEESINFEPSDVVEAETVGSPHSEQEVNTHAVNFQAIVEQCVRPLVAEVKAQALALAEKDRIIEEQGRQLRLLPDLQKQAEKERILAEEERRAAQLRAHEAEALRKQIVAIEQEKEKKEAEAAEALRAAEELKVQSAELTEQLAAEAEEKKRVDEQLAEMKTHLEALTAKVERSWWKKFFGVQ